MTSRSRFQVVEGPVTRIIGSHRTTDVSVNEHTSTQHPVPPDTHYRTETHTFVNSAREFVMLLEVKGRTLKLVSDDYIALAEGDLVRAICEPLPQGPLRVVDWLNRTRSIAFRSIPQPSDGLGQRLFVCAILGALGTSFVLSGAPLLFHIVGGFVLLAAIAILAEGGVAFRSRARTHAELDRLTV